MAQGVVKSLCELVEYMLTPDNTRHCKELEPTIRYLEYNENDHYNSGTYIVGKENTYEVKRRPKYSDKDAQHDLRRIIKGDFSVRLQFYV